MLRFRFDGEDQGWSLGRRRLGSDPDRQTDPDSDRDPDGGAEVRAASGSEWICERESPGQVLTRAQQVELLRLVHDGLGRLMACSQLKVSERALRRTLAQSENFRRALEHVERMRAENLFAILYTAALRGDTQAARFLLARHDRKYTD